MKRQETPFVYEELFLFELKIAQYRNDIKNNYTLKFDIKENSLVNKFIKSLPFELTNAQKNAVNEILNDLNSQKPMRRMLEGDVGSGKTVVACIMLLAAIENGYQTAIMAPTEILARQHYNNFIKWLLPMGISVSLLLGSTSQK
ncbi:MAG: DEAD/DEAH box helicase [Candidatus Melainabacteria bacterium]|nr:MAG: DEAD/DEAH box helicase [Candidatus Melainabacteria bacterium]